MKYLISGGGTGGHIFPAVSIANALRELDPTCEILFVGALGRMEMERVPQAGYHIVGLPVKGFDRSHPWRNVRVVIDLVRSMIQARKIVRDFRPDVGIGVGGFFDKVTYLAKHALLRPIDQPNPDPFYAQLEQELLEEINALGIGPQGFGGRTTCLGVSIESAPTHVASLPVAVNVSCHVTRRATAEL